MESRIKRLVSVQLEPRPYRLLVAVFLLLLASCSNPRSGETAAPTTMLGEAPAASEDSAASGDVEEDAGERENLDAAEESEGDAETSGAAESEEGDSNAEPQLEPAAGSLPGKSIKVCFEGSAPDIFVFGEETLPVLGLRHAVSENLYTTTGYKYRAQGLEKLPSLADGDARRNTVTVSEGDRVVDVHGNVVSLRKGVSVYDAGGELVDYAGEPIDMEQMEVDFTFRPLVWSDGTPVSAVDSIFSFNVAADPQTAANKAKTGFTESYKATDDLSVRWTGLPGFLDQTYFTNVWAPLPAHVLSQFTAAELGELEEVAREPLSSGPFVINEWIDENTIHLRANPYYYRSDEGLPVVQDLTIQFGDLETLLEDESGCDLLAGGALGAQNLPDLEESGDLEGWELITSPGNVYEQIAFSVWPIFEIRERRPDWFGDVQVRQAIAHCTDRQRMVEELTQDRGVILDTLAPVDHPLVADDLTSWAYDPQQGNEMLDKAGYLDYAGDGRRQDVTSGVPMTLTLGTNSESTLRLRITEIFEENMAECGIPVDRYDRPAGTWFGDGPAGPVFGRKFDMAALAWLGHVVPDCTTFISDNIPGPEDQDFAGWRAPNVSGWSDEAYDEACRTAVRALPGGQGYEESMGEVMRLFNEQLPALPLFTNYKAVAVRPGVENVIPDATQPSALWNIAEWDVTE